MRIAVFGIALFLLYFAWNQILTERSKKPWPSYPPKTYLLNHYDNADLAELVRSYATGNKRRLPKEIKGLHQRLGLLHLLTPSGLHLSTAWLWLTPLLLLFKRYWKWAPEFSSLLITIGAWSLEGVHSLQRMALFRLLSLNLGHIPIIRFLKMRTELSFLLSFGLAWILGNYHNSPLSFALSFLFLSTILSHRKNGFALICGLLAAQAAVQASFGQPFFVLGSLYGMFLTLLFSFVFPFFLLDYWIWSKVNWLPGNFEWLASFYYKLCEWGNLLTPVSLATDPSFFLVLFFLLLPINFRGKKAFLLILFLFHTETAMNLPRSGHLQSYRTRVWRNPFLNPNIERTRRGYKTWDEEWICYHRLLNWNFQLSCRRRKQAQTNSPKTQNES